MAVNAAGTALASRSVDALVGRQIPGIPAGWNGFVPVDGRGRVDGIGGVWATGDMTSYPARTPPRGRMASRLTRSSGSPEPRHARTLKTARGPLPAASRPEEGRLAGDAEPLGNAEALELWDEPLDRDVILTAKMSA